MKPKRCQVWYPWCHRCALCVQLNSIRWVSPLRLDNGMYFMAHVAEKRQNVFGWCRRFESDKHKYWKTTSPETHFRIHLIGKFISRAHAVRQRMHLTKRGTFHTHTMLESSFCLFFFLVFHVFSYFLGKRARCARRWHDSRSLCKSRQYLPHAVKHFVSCIRWFCLWYCTNTIRTTDAARMNRSWVLVVYSGESLNLVNQFFNCSRRMQTCFAHLPSYLLADGQINYSVHVQKWNLHNAHFFIWICALSFNSNSEINYSTVINAYANKNNKNVFNEMFRTIGSFLLIWLLPLIWRK